MLFNVILITVYMTEKGYFSFYHSKTRSLEESDISDSSYSVKKSIVLTCLIAGITFIVSLAMINYSRNLFFYSKLMVLYFILSLVALTDYKRHIIPNFFIIIGIASRLIFYLLEFIFCEDLFVDILKNDALGFALGFILVFGVVLIMKNSLGFGDVKLYGLIGITSSVTCTMFTLVFSLFSCSVVSIILLFTKKKNKKSNISLAPFIYVAFSVCVVLGIY